MTEATLTDSLYQKSPLDTLVRQSSRRAQVNTRPGALSHHGGSQPLDRNPVSPLLHTRFRASASTASSSLREDDVNTTTGQSQHLSWSRDDESVYSRMSNPQSYSPTPDTPGFKYIIDSVGDRSPMPSRSPTPSSSINVPERDRQSWASYRSNATAQVEGSNKPHRDTWRSSSGGVDPFSFRQYESPTATAVPRVVVSSPTSSSLHSSPQKTSDGSTRPLTSRPSVTQYSISNFSRPIRYPSVRDEQSKQEVLDRNRSPPRPVQPHGQRHQELSQIDQAVHANDWQRDYHYDTPSHISSPLISSTPPTSGREEPRTPATPHSRGAYTTQSIHSESVPSGMTRSISPHSVPGPSHIRLPNSPPSPRPTSKASLYSAYSYYQLDGGSRTPSPSSPYFQPPGVPGGSNVQVPSENPPSRLSPSPSQPPPSVPTPEDFLSLGIQHHEANRLTESAICFERAATLNGGSGVGMLMWGLSLRHGWGTAKDEKAAFRWLRRAAEAAVDDLESARNGVDQTAVKSELVLAIYEVGQCFFHGWGVAQDKKMAVSYFQVAARLGDSDAQQELGYCLANGKGCKKNLKEAAKWYRAAVAQGASTVGLAWIHKSKYL